MHYETPLLVVSVVLALAGLAAAAWLFGGARRSRRAAARALRRRCTAWLSGKYFVDELYERVLGRPLVWISDRVFLRFGDRALHRRHAARPGRDRPRQRRPCSDGCRPAACISTPGSCSLGIVGALLWSWRHV